ncbi:MAG: sulfotransferase [Rhizomicrobium sp.]
MSDNFQTAITHHQQGNLEDAERHYRAALEAEPDHFNTLNNLGLLLFGTNRAEEALTLTRKAATLDPRNAETLSNLGEMLAATGEDAEAIATFRKSLAANPVNVRTLHRFIRALQMQGRAEDALPFLAAAARQRPQDPDIHQMLGKLLLAMGRIVEAQAAFRVAVNAVPNGHYYRDFASVTQLDASNRHISRMEATLRDPNLPPDQLIALQFALGKVYTDTRDHDHALIHQTEGNRLRRAQMNYNEDAELARIAQVKAEYSAERLHAAGDPSDRPVFIIGMPRAGGTLVEQILACHPQVGAIGETSLWQKSVTSALGDAGTSDIDDEKLRAIGAAYVAGATRLKPSAKRIVDRTVLNFLHAGLIHMALPNARIIHITRDPVDTCLSIYAEEFPSGPAWLFELGEMGRFYRAYADLMAHWREVLPEGTMLEVRYEDIVADVETQTRRMLEHIGLPWDAACLNFHKSNRPVWSPSAVQVRKPIYATSIGRWRPNAEALKPLLDALGEVAA